MIRATFVLTAFLLAGEVMSGPNAPLKLTDIGPYRELAARPNPERLMIQYVPSLAAILRSKEEKKGSSLTRAEVEALRDKANAMVVSPEMAKDVEDRRGYKDIHPSHAWEQWQILRVQFTK